MDIDLFVTLMRFFWLYLNLLNSQIRDYRNLLTNISNSIFISVWIFKRIHFLVNVLLLEIENLLKSFTSIFIRDKKSQCFDLKNQYSSSVSDIEI